MQILQVKTPTELNICNISFKNVTLDPEGGRTTLIINDF